MAVPPSRNPRAASQSVVVVRLTGDTVHQDTRRPPFCRPLVQTCRQRDVSSRPHPPDPPCTAARHAVPHPTPTHPPRNPIPCPSNSSPPSVPPCVPATTA